MAKKYVCEVGCPGVVEDIPGTCSNCGSDLVEKEESQIPAEWLNPTPEQPPVTPVIPPIPVASIPVLPTIVTVTVADDDKSQDFIPGEYTIGRGVDSDFRVTDGAVSRTHLLLSITDTVVTVTVDPNVSNPPITVNGSKTDEPVAPIELPLGSSTIEIGENTILTITTTTA